jgi:hypothetical protein
MALHPLVIVIGLVILGGAAYYFWANPIETQEVVTPSSPQELQAFSNDTLALQPGWDGKLEGARYLHEDIQSLSEQDNASLLKMKADISDANPQSAAGKEWKNISLLLIDTLILYQEHQTLLTAIESSQQGFCEQIPKYEELTQTFTEFAQKSLELENRMKQFSASHPEEAEIVGAYAIPSTPVLESAQELSTSVEAAKALC